MPINSKGAQEAHEAIRPTYMENLSAGGDNQEKKLYELIWKRTITSQMADAELEKTVIKINISGTPEQYEAQGEVIIFDGFLRVYSESKDDGDVNIEESEDSGLLPAVETGQAAALHELTATQKFASSPPRYTEASLVKKLEELGIGRPSTYAPIISTIQKRNYVVKEDRDGTKRMYDVLTLKIHQIRDEVKSEITGCEKNKLFPTDIGSVANDFLTKHFDQFLNYEFTAKVEIDFDEIAAENKNWSLVVDAIYKPLHDTVIKTLEESERATGSRLLGAEPKSDKNVYVKIGRYGPLAQIGETEDEDKKFANLRKGMRLETITLEESLDLFKLQRSVGPFEEKEMVIGIGRFGPYIRHNSAYYSLGKEDDPVTVNSDRAIEIIQNKREADAKKVISKFDTDPVISVLNGRLGPYITKGKDNYKIPKDRDSQTLTLEDCEKIIETVGVAKPTRKPPRGATKKR